MEACAEEEELRGTKTCVRTRTWEKTRTGAKTIVNGKESDKNVDKPLYVPEW